MAGNYVDKILERICAEIVRGERPSPGIVHTFVGHDNWCGMYQGNPCNCDPKIRTGTEEEARKLYAEGRSVGQNQKRETEQ